LFGILDTAKLFLRRSLGAVSGESAQFSCRLFPVEDLSAARTVGWVGAFADFGSVFGTADGVPPVCITRFSSGEGTSVFVGALKLYLCHRDPTFLEQTSRFSSSTESKKEKLCEVGSSEEMTVAVGRKTFRVGPGAAKPPSLWVYQETTFVGTSAWVDRGQPTTEGTVDG